MDVTLAGDGIQNDENGRGCGIFRWKVMDATVSISLCLVGEGEKESR